MTENKISGGEFATLILVALLSCLGTLSASDLGDNYLDAAIAILLASAVNLTFLVLLLKYHKENDPITGNKIYLAFCLFFFMYSAAADISSIIHMMKNTVFSQMNAYGFALIFVGAALYCCWLGTATAARCSQLAAGVVAVSSFLMLMAAVKNIDFENMRIPFYSGTENFSNTFLMFWGRITFLPQCLFLLEDVDLKGSGSTSKVVISYVIFALFCSMAIVLVLLCLGCFSVTQEFPLFTFASFLDLPPVQRLDIFLGVSLLTSGLIKIAVTFIAVRKCCAALIPSGNPVFSFAAAAITALASAFLAETPGLISKLSTPLPLILSGIILGIAVPLMAGIGGKLPGMRGR